MRAARLLAVVLAASAVGCDFSQFGFLGSIPISGDVETAYVYLAVDGLAPDVVQRAKERGAPGFESMRLARLVAMFPVTSDASWTRLLRARRMKGYELHYYDPVHDELVHSGYVGLAAHALPPVDGLFEAPAYFDAFDYHADGYFDVVQTYALKRTSFGESLDGLFATIGSRTETDDVFFGYLLDLDVFGHTLPRAELGDGFTILWDRIQRLRESHPERRFVFTLFSDHGFDDVAAEPEHFVDFPEELRRLGVEPVDALRQGRGEHALYAVPLVHTYVSYIALHTEPALASEVARIASMSPTTDLVMAKGTREPPPFGAETWAWLDLWRGGRRVLRAAHDPARDEYWIEQGSELEALEIRDLHATSSGGWLVATDEAVFAATARGRYPDLIYRAFTALAPVTVEHPADVLVSFRRPYTSRGFRTITSVEEQAVYAFHGSIDAGSSMGVLLSEERDLPEVIRSEELLELLPRLREHIEEKGIDLRQLTRIERLER